MFSDFEGYSGQVISQEDYAAGISAAPTHTPEQIAASIIEEAKQEADQIIAAARANADKIANDGLLAQMLNLEAEKQRELDSSIAALSGMVGDVVEQIIGKQLPSSIASDIFKTALKKFEADKALVVEAASDVYPRIQLIARIDQSRAPGRIKVVEKTGLEAGKIIIMVGAQRFHADAASQIETFRSAVLALNDPSKRG